MAIVIETPPGADYPFGLGGHISTLDLRDYALAVDEITPLPDRWIIGPPYTKYSMAPGTNQGNLPECGGYTGDDIARYFGKRNGQGVLPLDPHWLYFHSRARAGIPANVAGTTGAAVAETMRLEGIPLLGKPATALDHRIGSWARLRVTDSAMARALIQYEGPVMIGLAWPENWFYPKAGVLPKPSSQIAGGHLLEIIGRDVNVNGGSVLLDNHWNGWPGSNKGKAWARISDITDLIHDAIKVLDVGVAGAHPPQ